MADRQNDSSGKKKRPRFLRCNLGLLMLAVAMTISMTQVIITHQNLTPPDKSVVRIAFYQLEEGYRDAMKLAINRYEQMYPGVRIEMMAVTQKVYAQWINVHLIAGTAPDLVETGGSNLIASDHYKVKYFTPLTDYLAEPNPYNKDTLLEEIPWRDTFVDGGKTGFSEPLQDFYSVQTTYWGTSMYVNMDMYTAATGKTRLPQSFQEFTHACENIRTLPSRSQDHRYQGQQLCPIVAVDKLDGFENNINAAFMSSLEPMFDLDLNGGIANEEVYAAYARGDLDFYKTPQLKGMFECLHDLVNKQFGDEFLAMDRQTAVFKFVQGKACFLSSGSWDGKTLEAQTRGRFRVVPMKYPVPVKGERWGDLANGRATTAAATAGGGYAVYRFSPHREVAVDFLRFLTSIKMNNDFNKVAQWAPAVVGIEIDDMMKPFMPDPIGFTAYARFNFEEALDREYTGQSQAFMIGQISYDDFVRNFSRVLNDPINGGDHAWGLRYKKERESIRNDDRSLAAQDIAALMTPDASDAKGKYNRILLQQTRKNYGQYHAFLFRLTRNKPIPEE